MHLEIESIFLGKAAVQVANRNEPCPSETIMLWVLLKHVTDFLSFRVLLMIMIHKRHTERHGSRPIVKVVPEEFGYIVAQVNVQITTCDASEKETPG